LQPLAIDLHVHVGVERLTTPIADFVTALEARRVALAGFVDHAEYYFGKQSDWARRVRKNLETRGERFYAADPAGLRLLYADIDAVARRTDMRIVKGLELGAISEVPDSVLELPDFLANCFGNVEIENGTTFGERATSRIRRFGQRIRHTGKPGIINHPFRDRIHDYHGLVSAAMAPSPESFITADDIARVTDACREFSLFIEINLGTIGTMTVSDPCLDLAAYVIGSLAESGADLSIGSDSHQPPAPTFPDAVVRVVRESGLSSEHVDRAVDRFARYAEPAQ